MLVRQCDVTMAGQLALGHCRARSSFPTSWSLRRSPTSGSWSRNTCPKDNARIHLVDSTLSNPSFEGVSVLRVLLSWDSGDARHEEIRDVGGVVLNGD
jgi:hypothetical protein